MTHNQRVGLAIMILYAPAMTIALLERVIPLVVILFLIMAFGLLMFTSKQEGE